MTDADPYIPGAVGPDGNGVNWWTNQNVSQSNPSSTLHNADEYLRTSSALFEIST